MLAKQCLASSFINMGSGPSQEADTHQIKESPNNPISHTYHHNQNEHTNLPHNREVILKEVVPVIDKSSVDHLYAGVFLNQNRQKYWVDKTSQGNSFMVFARDLSITWGEDSRYWHWPYFKETSEVFVHVAELLNVCWLDVNGTFEMAKLTPAIKYEVVFVAMLKDPAHGWEVPVNVRLVLPDGTKQEHKESLMEKPRGRWIEIPVGEFTVKPNKGGGCMQFSLYEYEGLAWKRGLIIKGAAITPKNYTL